MDFTKININSNVFDFYLTGYGIEKVHRKTSAYGFRLETQNYPDAYYFSRSDYVMTLKDYEALAFIKALNLLEELNPGPKVKINFHTKLTFGYISSKLTKYHYLIEKDIYIDLFSKLVNLSKKYFDFCIIQIDKIDNPLKQHLDNSLNFDINRDDFGASKKIFIMNYNESIKVKNHFIGKVIHDIDDNELYLYGYGTPETNEIENRVFEKKYSNYELGVINELIKTVSNPKEKINFNNSLMLNRVRVIARMAFDSDYGIILDSGKEEIDFKSETLWLTGFLSELNKPYLFLNPLRDYLTLHYEQKKTVVSMKKFNPSIYGNKCCVSICYTSASTVRNKFDLLLKMIR